MDSIGGLSKVSLLREASVLAFGTLADKKGPAPVREAEPSGPECSQNSDGVHSSYRMAVFPSSFLM